MSKATVIVPVGAIKAVPGSCAPAIDAALAVVEAKPRAVRSTIIDLSGAAVVDQVLLHATQNITITKATVLYVTENSSANTGVAIKIGKETDDNYFYDGTSEASKTKWDETLLSLLATNLDAGDSLVVGSAGSKTGTGEIMFCIEYTIN